MMKIFKLTFKKTIYFIILWIILWLVYKFNKRCCEPCPEGVDCPPCISEAQKVAIIIYGISVVYLLICLIYEVVIRNRKS